MLKTKSKQLPVSSAFTFVPKEVEFYEQWTVSKKRTLYSKIVIENGHLRTLFFKPITIEKITKKNLQDLYESPQIEDYPDPPIFLQLPKRK